MAGLSHRFAAAIPVAAATLALLTGCGDEGGDPSDLAALAPPDSPLYAEAALLPDGEQTDAIASLAERIGGIADPRQRLIELLDAELEAEDTGATFEEDIEPWLGESGAVFTRSFDATGEVVDSIDAAYLLEVTDTDAAQDFIDALAASDPEVKEEEREYEGSSYLVDPDSNAFGLVGDILVAGTEPGFKAAVDASNGDSLADSESFSEQVGSLDDDVVAEAWFDLEVALDAAAAEAGNAERAEIDAARAALGPLLSEPIAATLEATEETAALEVSSAGTGGVTGNTDLLGSMPAGAWFAVATEDYGEALSQTLESLGMIGAELGDPSLDVDAIGSAIERQTGLDIQEDILSWVDDVALFVSGTSGDEFNAGALVGSTDAAATAEAANAAAELFAQQTGVEPGESQIEGATAGFSATGVGGSGLDVGVLDDMLVAAIGPAGLAEDLVDPEEPLSEDELFGSAAEALGDDFDGSVFVALQDFLVVAEKGDDGDTDYDAARPYTQALEYLIFGTAEDEDEDRERSRFVLGVGD